MSLTGCHADLYKNVDFSQPVVRTSFRDTRGVRAWLDVPALPGITVGDAGGRAIRLKGSRWYGSLPLISADGMEGNTATVPILFQDWVHVIPPDAVYTEDEWGSR